jgi:hypothetical protein
MSLFRAAPFNLDFNDLIIAQVKATNVIGEGLFSDPNTQGIRIQTEPNSPLTAPIVVSYDEQSVEL